MKRILQALLLSCWIAAAAALAQTHHGTGIVKKVDAAKGTVSLKHEAITSLNWPAMTMDFPVRDKSLLSSLKPEQVVKFELVQDKGRYVITAIK
jgi:Cu/Ag efflux protein CusF